MAKSVMKTVTAIVRSGQGTIVSTARIEGAPLVGACPKCGAAVYENNEKNGFFCSLSNCGFCIRKDEDFFTALGKTLTAKAVGIILRDRRITVKNCRLFNSSKTFTATIACDFSGPSPAYLIEKKK